MPADFQAGAGLTPRPNRLLRVRGIGQENRAGYQPLGCQVQNASGGGGTHAEIVGHDHQIAQWASVPALRIGRPHAPPPFQVPNSPLWPEAGRPGPRSHWL